MGDLFISPEYLKTLTEGATPPRILDVRKRAAFDESGQMIPGARWHDPFAISHWINGLDNKTAHIIYCVHGHEVSQNTAQTLRDAGCDARALEGGFEAWREAGFDVLPAAGNTST